MQVLHNWVLGQRVPGRQAPEDVRISSRTRSPAVGPVSSAPDSMSLSKSTTLDSLTVPSWSSSMSELMILILLNFFLGVGVNVKWHASQTEAAKSSSPDVFPWGDKAFSSNL